MKLFQRSGFVLFLLVALSLFFVPSAQAIIFLPPLLLIPLLGLLGGMTAVMSVPAAIFSAIITHLRKPKTKKQFVLQTIITTIFFLLILSVLLFIFLKLQNPERPLL